MRDLSDSQVSPEPAAAAWFAADVAGSVEQSGNACAAVQAAAVAADAATAWPAGGAAVPAAHAAAADDAECLPDVAADADAAHFPAYAADAAVHARAAGFVDVTGAHWLGIAAEVRKAYPAVKQPAAGTGPFLQGQSDWKAVAETVSAVHAEDAAGRVAWPQRQGMTVGQAMQAGTALAASAEAACWE